MIVIGSFERRQAFLEGGARRVGDPRVVVALVDADGLLVERGEGVVVNQSSIGAYLGGGDTFDRALFAPELAAYNAHACTIVVDDFTATDEEVLFFSELQVTRDIKVPAGERTLTFNCHSKSFAMTGWRLGYTVAPPEVVPALVMMAVNTYTCVAEFTQYAAIEALLCVANPCS